MSALHNSTHFDVLLFVNGSMTNKEIQGLIFKNKSRPNWTETEARILKRDATNKLKVKIIFPTLFV